MAEAHETTDNTSLYDTVDNILEQHRNLGSLGTTGTDHTFVYDPESRQRYADFAKGILEIHDEAVVETVRMMGSRILDITSGNYELLVFLEDLGGYVPHTIES